MKKNKGIIQHMKECNEAKPSNKNFGEKLRDIFNTQFRKATKQRKMWLFENALKQFHKTLGDDGFHDMITSQPITTDTKGAEYIRKFEDEYEKE